VRLPVGQSAAIGRRFIDLTPELTAAVVRTVEAGWSIALGRPEVTAQADEVTITECVRDAMRAALDRHRFPWRKTMAVLPGTESRSQGGMVSPDGRTDIPLFLTRVFARSGEHDPHAIIECKRIAEGDASLAREYVIEGIDRFRKGKYAENHRRGFMIGYVLVGSPQKVVDGVNRYLTGRFRSPEALTVSPLVKVMNTWQSEHPRESEGPIKLEHAMLAFGKPT
jgi:hypothetical protein